MLKKLPSSVCLLAMPCGLASAAQRKADRANWNGIVQASGTKIE